jgi:ABC-type bacteriocin/lantibiotic exporter with double-glycine peptidase domain
MSRLTDDLKRAGSFIHHKDNEQRVGFSELRHLIPFFKEHRRKVLFVVLLIVVVSLLSMPGPLLIKYIIDEVIIAKDIGMLNLIVGLLVFLALAKLLFSFLKRYLSTVASQEVVISLRQTLFSRILHFPLSFFNNYQTGYLVSRIKEVDSLGALFSAVVSLLGSFLNLIFALCIMLYLSWELTLVSLIVLPLFYVVTRRYTGSLRRVSRDYMEKGAMVSRQYQETLSGISVVKSSAAEDREKEKTEISLKGLLQTGIDRNVISSLASELVGLVAALGGFVLLWYSGRGIIGGSLTVGTYIAAAGYLVKVYSPIQTFATAGITLQPALAALQRVSELMTTVTEDEKGKLPVTHLEGRITFNDVYFSYDGNQEVIHDLNFEIQPGEKIAFAGPSGVGKSTILNLLLGFYKPDKGSVLIDGRNIHDLSLQGLRERIGIVSQNTFLFNDSIRNNILYSNPKAVEDEVVEAAELADAHDFVVELPHGYDTMVGEQGFALSGGQRQRLSIARAILKSPDIIIFDEATSELDSEAEERIKDMLTKLSQTCIIITHRLSLLGFVDRVIALDGGKIVWSGRPQNYIIRRETTHELEGSLPSG